MSGAKDPDNDERDGAARPNPEPATRAAPARAAQAARPPSRPLSRPLFELDEPAASPGVRPGAVDALPAAAIARGEPANDRAAPARPPIERAASQPLVREVAHASRLVDEQFESLASNSQLAGLPERPSRAPEQGMRALTHVSAGDSFDVTLKLPKPSDALESRRTRLTGRFKAAVAAYKVLSGLGLDAVASKDVVDLFDSYEVKLRAAVPEERRKLELEALHAELPIATIEDLERLAHKLEERLLAYDDNVLEADFAARVTRDKQPPKVLLRYARLLAARRFNIGYRRDRFEYLALQLLTATTPDQRLVLAPRDKAATVLAQLLGGLAQTSPPEERAPAVAHLREALDRLAELATSRQFFQSEFFLDLHGYKISMRDQVASPEFLYLAAALHVEIHNRMLAWSQHGSETLAALLHELAAQKTSAEGVFANFRRPRATPLPAKPSVKPAIPRLVAPPSAAKAAAGAVVAPTSTPPDAATSARGRPLKRRRKQAEAAPAQRRGPALKLAAIALVIVASVGSTLYSAGLVELVEPPVRVAASELVHLSPLIHSATLHDGGKRLEALLSRPAWLRLSNPERRALALELALKLKDKGIQTAKLLAYRTPVIQIEYATVVYVDEAAP